MTQQYRLASMAAWLSSTGISHHNLLPHFPWSVSLQSTAALTLGLLHNPYVPSSQLLHLLGDLHPSLGCVWLWQGLILIAFRLPQISCFTLSLKCFSSDSDNWPDVGTGPRFSSSTS